MEIKADKKNGINILYLAGKMTIGDGDVKLRKAFRDLLEAGERQFLFDMSEVPYLDSAAVGETVACYKRASDQGGVIKVVMPPGGKAHEVFVLTYLDRVFQIFPDEDEALASFAS